MYYNFIPNEYGYALTGSYGTNNLTNFNGGLELDDSSLDRIAEKMMERTKKVIIPCRYCNSHNAFTNPTCIKCGAPLG